MPKEFIGNTIPVSCGQSEAGFVVTMVHCARVYRKPCTTAISQPAVPSTRRLVAKSMVTNVNAPAADYPALFRANIGRAMNALADALPIQGVHAASLSEEGRERGLHLLSFALKLHAIWPQTRAVLLKLSPWLEIQGYRQAWIEVLEQGLEIAQGLDDRAACAQLHLHIGRLHVLLGSYGPATAHLTDSRRLAEETGDTATLVDALNRLARVALLQSDFATARTLAELAFARLETDAPERLPGYLVLGRIAALQGEWETAIGHQRRALDLASHEGAPLLQARVLRDLGATNMLAGRYAEAIANMEEAIVLFGIAGNEYEKAIGRMNLGVVYWQRGEFEQASACYELCEPVFLKMGSRANMGQLYNNRGLVYRDLGHFEEAQRAFTTAVHWSRLHGDRQETANILESMSGLYLCMGEREKARAVLHEALAELAYLPEGPRYVHQAILASLARLDGEG